MGDNSLILGDISVGYFIRYFMHWLVPHGSLAHQRLGATCWAPRTRVDEQHYFEKIRITWPNSGITTKNISRFYVF